LKSWFHQVCNLVKLRGIYACQQSSVRRHTGSVGVSINNRPFHFLVRGLAARAAGVLCFFFSAAILWAAYVGAERPTGPGLNRWHEGAFLAVLGLVRFFWFGRDLASNRLSSVGFFVASDLAEAESLHRGALPSGAQIIHGCEGEVKRQAIGVCHCAGQRVIGWLQTSERLTGM
jgi:hypothetical protein